MTIARPHCLCPGSKHVCLPVCTSASWHPRRCTDSLPAPPPSSPALCIRTSLCETHRCDLHDQRINSLGRWCVYYSENFPVSNISQIADQFSRQNAWGSELELRGLTFMLARLRRGPSICLTQLDVCSPLGDDLLSTSFLVSRLATDVPENAESLKSPTGRRWFCRENSPQVQ